jgi:hypothetical protein
MNTKDYNFMLELKNSKWVMSNHWGRKNFISNYANKVGIIHEVQNNEIIYTYNKKAYKNYMKYESYGTDLYKLIKIISEKNTRVISNYLTIKEELFQEKWLIELSVEYKLLYLYGYNIEAFNTLLDNIFIRLVCEEYKSWYNFKKLLIDNIFILWPNVHDTVTSIHKWLECLNKNDKIGYLFYEMNQNNFSEYSLKDMIQILIKNKDVNFNIKITEDFYFNPEINCMIIKDTTVNFDSPISAQILWLLLHTEWYNLSMDYIARKIATEKNNDLDKIKTWLEDTTFQNIKKYLRKKWLTKEIINSILIKDWTYYRLKKMN